MRRIISNIAFLCLSSFTATSGLAVIAGGCNSHMNKKAEIQCTEDDSKCQNDKAKEFELNKTIRS
tara:strand:- start:156 stop:350 length:195 start_codon:yes stop_codon:yes gene_type:complete